MSNKDRPGKTISFYADQTTLAELAEMVKLEDRSVSNMLRVLINRAWELHYSPDIKSVDMSDIYVRE